MNIATFSIVARDPQTGELGVAVQSKFLAVGAYVPYARAGAGAIATQANCNLDMGELGLRLLEKGYTAEKVLRALLELDEERETRQIGIVDAMGGSAAFTGSECHAWAGHLCGENFSCQGNILVSEKTVEALAETFTETEGPLATRLVRCLEVAQDAGGDRRGRQSAALRIVQQGQSYGGYNDVKIDLRVDDHPEPIRELSRLLDLYEIYFGKTEHKVEATPETVSRVQTKLAKLGYYSGKVNGLFDEATRKAFSGYCGVENYEERICEGDFFDQVVLDKLLD